MITSIWIPTPPAAALEWFCSTCRFSQDKFSRFAGINSPSNFAAGLIRCLSSPCGCCSFIGSVARRLSAILLCCLCTVAPWGCMTGSLPPASRYPHWPEIRSDLSISTASGSSIPDSPWSTSSHDPGSSTLSTPPVSNSTSSESNSSPPRSRWCCMTWLYLSGMSSATCRLPPSIYPFSRSFFSPWELLLSAPFRTPLCRCRYWSATRSMNFWGYWWYSALTQSGTPYHQVQISNW